VKQSFSPVIPPHLRAVAQEWNEIGPLRHRLICEGRDLSFDQILCPYVLKSLRLSKVMTVFDAGCGTGNLAIRIADHGYSVVGVDVSDSSIAIANRDNNHKSIDYVLDSVEHYSRNIQRPFDAFIANMLLMDTPNVIEMLSSARRTVRLGGIMCVTILHPIFYMYLINKTPGLDYLSETSIPKEFRTTLFRHSRLFRTHWHRSIAFYVKQIIRAGFQLISVDELAPPKSLRHLYGAAGRYPRFLGATAKAI
jgi:2-polyprenyl-3-methyl-5-hydroxy-6-metoxy-1,4-benzoquinol methylase